VLERTQYIFSVKDYIRFRMNGESVADYTDRPYALGLYEKAMPRSFPGKKNCKAQNRPAMTT